MMLLQQHRGAINGGAHRRHDRTHAISMRCAAHRAQVQESDAFAPSTSGSHDEPCAGMARAHGGQHGAMSRRHAASALAAIASGNMLQAAAPEPAHALKTLTLKDGTSVEVFEHGMSLGIVALRGSIPQQWILDYKSALGKYAGYTMGQRAQLNDIYKELTDLKSKNSAGTADVVTLGDVWLQPAIKAGLIQPIPNARMHRWWRLLSPRWQALVARDAEGRPDRNGQVYAAPYRWGATTIAYRRDRLERRGGVPIQDWPDLLQPQLQGRVAMTDSSRELLGIALKIMGFGFNTTAAELAAAGKGPQDLGDVLRTLRKQVKLFSARDHVRALGAGDVWAVVGWSQELTLVGERSNSMAVVVPRSGTALFADLWAVPQGAAGGHMQAGPSPLLPSWLEFGLAPARAATLPGLKSGASPLLLSEGPAPKRSSPSPSPSSGGLPADPSFEVELTHASGYLPRDRGCLARSEFLLPLDADTVALYREALAVSSQPTAAAPAAAAK